MKNHNNLVRGILLAFLTSIISGISIFYSKVSVARIDPLVLAASRNLLVGFMFAVPFFAGGNFAKLKNLTHKELIMLILVGIIGGSIPFYLFFSGVKLAGAQNANMIHKTLFIWVALLSGFALGEKSNLLFVASGILVFAGNILFAPAKLVFGIGELMILAATLMWAVENILAKKILANVTSEAVSFFRMGIGGVILFSLTFATGKAPLLARLSTGDLQVIAIGAAILFFYVFAWYKALKYAPAGLVTLILTFSLVVGNVLSGSFARVHFSGQEVFSTVLIAGGVVLITAKHILGSLRRSATS